ncbi:MAG: hypothetical protein V4563_15070 [Pseudomonadota bacterium]
MSGFNSTSGAAIAAIKAQLISVVTGLGSMLVSFIQSGAGALLTRTVLDKLREYVTITDFAGVVGDGTTVCTDGFKAAIAAHRHLDIPEGTFLISPTATSGDYMLYLGTQGAGGNPTSRDGMVIKGRGEKSIIKLGAAVGRAALLFGGAVGDVLQNMEFRDMTIDLNGANNLQTSYGDPLRYNNAFYFFCQCKNIRFTNVTFLNASGSQIVRIGGDTSGTYGENIRFVGCHVKNFGIGLPSNLQQDCSAFYVQANRIKVVDCDFECDDFTFDLSRGHTALELHGDKSTVVRGNTFTRVQLPTLIASSAKATYNVLVDGNQYDDCNYLMSLDSSATGNSQSRVTVSNNIYASLKVLSVIFNIGTSVEGNRTRESINFHNNTVTTWGNTAQDNHLFNLESRYISSLNIQDNEIGGLNGSLVYIAGVVRNSPNFSLSITGNKLDSLGSSSGVYPNSPTFVHIEPGSGTIGSVVIADNKFFNSGGKDYSGLGLLKLTGTITYLYVTGNENHVSSAYPLSSGSPTCAYKTIQVNYLRDDYEANHTSAVQPCAAGASVNIFNFTGWTANDWSVYRVTVFTSDGGSTNNGMTDYDVLVCGSGAVAIRLANVGTYATDVVVEFSGTQLRVKNNNGSTLYFRIVIRGVTSRDVAFSV